MTPCCKMSKKMNLFRSEDSVILLRKNCVFFFSYICTYNTMTLIDVFDFQKQEGYPNSVGSEYGAPASPSPSVPSDTYGSPSPSTGYGAPSGPGSLY